jgi:integrase
MITFYLKNPDRETSYIWVQGYLSDGRIRKSTGLQIETRYWKQGWVNPKGCPVATRRKIDTLESHLKHLRNRIDDYGLNQKVGGKPLLAADICAIISGKGAVTGAMFGQLYLDLIRKAERGEVLNPRNGARMAPLTIQSWVINRRMVLEIIGDIPVDAITIDHVRQFISSLSARGRSKNGSGVHIKGFKTALSWLHRLGMSNNVIHTHPEFRPKWEYVDKMYLTSDEVRRIESFDLSHNHYLDCVRDRWMVMYYTGLRVGDAQKLTLNHIQGDRIRLMNQKTGKVVVIPLHPRLKAIIDKHDGLPPNYSEQPINREIKVVGRMAGITAKFTYKETRSGVAQEVTKEKWELLSCHTARRSATTNLIKNGATHDIAGAMLGMTAKTFGIYNRLSADDKADKLMENGFYSV